MTTYLSIPTEDVQRAMTLGAMRDPVAGRYFVPHGLDLAQFQAWLADELKTAAKGVSLTQLLGQAEAAIVRAFPKAEWVRFEISEWNSAAGGHTYFTAVDRDESGSELSRAKAMIWRGKANAIKDKFMQATGSSLSTGMKVLMLVEPTFKARHGFGLVVVDIDPAFTLGDMEARLREIRRRLDNEGETDKNRTLPAPIDFCRVAVISPDGAAGLGDFREAADRLAAANLCQFEYFPAVFQGEQAKNSIREAFIQTHTAHLEKPFDAVVIIRGGGPQADLHWLNEYLLAKLVCRFPAPVFTGIGHERDSTILDEYAHRRFGTPSKVIGFIKETIVTRAKQAEENWNGIIQMIETRLVAEEVQVGKHYGDLLAAADKKVGQTDLMVNQHYQNIIQSANNQLGMGLAAAKTLHDTVMVGVQTRTNSADTVIEHISKTINERALSATTQIEQHTQYCFESIADLAKNQIELAQERSLTHWDGILNDANRIADQLTQRFLQDYSDIQFHAAKQIDTAEAAARDLMANILSHGVEPTLRRGFAMVLAGGRPVSSKADAKQHDQLEITFKDGSLKMIPEDGVNK